MWALIWIKIAPISLWVPIVWECVWVCELRQGHSVWACVCVLCVSRHEPEHHLICVWTAVLEMCVPLCVCVCVCVCICWVSQLCRPSITVKECPVPLMQSLIMVLTTWSLTLECITLRDRTCTISTYSLSVGQTWRERMGGASGEGAHSHCPFQNMSQKS